MYLRPVFTETDLDRIVALIAANPFGVLVVHGAAGLDASHVPFTVQRHAPGVVLSAHFAAANPLCALLDGTDALAIFTGPHAYISPGWYETQPAVPTWDYAAVHVHGRLSPLTDAAGMDVLMRDLASADPMGFDHAHLPPAYLGSMMSGIRAFRLTSERIEAQWKMSQNRSIRDRRRVIEALRAQGDDGVADLIESTLPKT